MSVRKRTWTTSKGKEHREAWLVSYTDGQGSRCFATFAKKKDADDFHATVRIDVKRGTHVSPSKSITVREAGEAWLAKCDADGLERSTRDSYAQHLTHHIYPYLGALKLSALNVAMVRDWQDKLRRGDLAPGQTGKKPNEVTGPRSADMVKRCTSDLGALIADAQERGQVAVNVVRSLKANRKRGKERQQERRKKGRLEIGKDIPTREEVNATLLTTEGRWRPLLMVAALCGLRASELRGLRWQDVDLKNCEIHVRQRADKYGKIGPTKSGAGTRTVPIIGDRTLRELTEWKVKCPQRDTRRKNANGEPIKERHLVFPNGRGNVEALNNILRRGFKPTLVRAGVAVQATDEFGPVYDKRGRPVMIAKYGGLHALRHFYASWCINRKVDLGLELPPKTVQTRLGHSSIQMTFDRYGHLFPSAETSAAEHSAADALFA
jgi:integrase